jgi:hypothetical protein
MLDSKFFFTLIGLVVAVFAISNTNMSPSISEGFWGNPGRTLKVHREVHPSGSTSTCGGSPLQNNYQSMLGNDKFVSKPNWQGMLSPRFSNVDYGANIKYNMPSYQNLGSPCEPLGLADMARENYQEDYGCDKGRGGCGVASCGKGGVGQVSSASSDHTQHVNSSGLVAVGDMTTINSDGAPGQQIIYDRYIFANRNSRLRAMGDPIRGDLPIVPRLTGWFNVAVNPNIDLHQGAMNVLGGTSNETSRSMAELHYATSGGYDTTIGGVNMANEFASSVSGGMGDIQVTAFP